MTSTRSTRPAGYAGSPATWQLKRTTLGVAVATTLFASHPAWSQTAATAGGATPGNTASGTPAALSTPPTPSTTLDAAPAATELPTVNVDGARGTTFRARSASVTGLDDAPLRDTPASVSVVNRALLDDQQAKRLSDVVRNDASVVDAYAPVGYYEGFAIRGFPIDLASAIRIDGLTVSGEQNIGLENKEQVEILKGLEGIDSGVIAPGGVINFVTKRPVDVASVTAGVDSRGSTSAALDLGRRFGVDNQFGIRINAAKENIHSYVDGANGRRTFGSIAADWNISPRASLQFDAEFQQLIQRSASGYQLLGGTVVPPAASASKLLGAQPWAKPVTTEALNLNARFDYQFSDAWSGYLAAGRSHTMIDDNVAFAYGCYYVASCGAGGTSPYFFSSTGDFDVYDYRSPGEYRRNDELKAVLTGKFATGPIHHELTFGASVQRRVVDLSNAVYDYVGSENIAGPALTFPPSPNSTSASFPQLDAHQYSVFGLDRISLNEHWQILAGGREVLLRQKSWSVIDGPETGTDKTVFLPQAALVYKPVEPLSLYVSYSRALSLGDQAPVRASNAYAFLPPIESSQVEAGAKYDWQNRLSLTAAVFSINKPFEFAQPDSSDAGYTFVQHGTERHQGIELSAAGRATERLTLTASLAAIRARAYDSGSPAYEGHQVINVPRLNAALYADYAMPGVAGLHLLGGVNYTGSKNANEEGSASVPAYFVFNLGASYTTKLGGHKTVVRLAMDNLFNKYYWQDAGESQGDAYLFLGAPRTARLSLTYDF